MKTIYLLSILSGFISTPEISEYSLTTVIRTEVAVPADSFVKQKNNVNFIMYSFVEEKEQVNYVLEGRSENSGWEIIDIRQGFRSPNGQKLAYYFKDTVEYANQKMNYRIKRVWAEKKLVPHTFHSGSRVTERAFSNELDDQSKKSFSFINRENYRKITVMYFDESGNLVNSNEYLNVSEINISPGDLELSSGKYYVVIDGDGILYPAKILEVVE